MKKITAIILALVLVASLASSAFAASETVYVTSEKSTVYHEKDCPSTWNGRYRTTLKEAHKIKLKPCPECNPSLYNKDDPESQEELVYVLMGKSVYHSCNCRLLWNEEAWQGTSMTVKTAKANDLRPCSICGADSLSSKSAVFQVSENGAYHAPDCRIIWHGRYRTTLDKLPENARPCSHCHPEG